MKKEWILLAAVVLLAITGLTHAQEPQPPRSDLSGNVTVRYLTSYIWRGFDYYADDHSAFDTTLNLDLYGTGLGTSITWRRAISAPRENAENLDVSLYYSNKLFEGQNYVTNYTTGWVYYGFPDEPRSGSATGLAADMQEVFVALSWPNICPFGIVPSYTVLTMWPSEGKSTGRKNAGWAHVVGLGYDLTVPGLTPESLEQVLHLSAAAVYNDGVAPGVVVGAASGTIDHDWSHAVFGVSTDFSVSNNLTLSPGVYFQSSWDDSVNSGDEYWASVSLSYAF